MRGARVTWRVFAATALTAAALVATAPPAAAHQCTSPAQMEIGKPTTVSVGVTIESTSPKYISVLIPTGMQVDHIFPATGGWTGRIFPPKPGNEVLYERGSFAPFSCAYFPIRLTATARGVYVLSVDQMLPDGQVVRLPSSNDYFVLPNGQTTHVTPGGPPNPLFEQIVYAGVPVGTAAAPAARGGAASVPNRGGGGGTSWLLPVLTAVAVGAGLGLLWFALRARDRRAKGKGKPRRLQLGESD